MNGYVQSDISALAFNNGEKPEDFHGSILRLQKEITLSGENFFPTVRLFHYIKTLSNGYKLRAFIAPKMIDLITFLDNNRKSVVYIGGDIHVIYRYLYMIGSPTTLTTSGQHYHHFSPLCSINNYAATLQPVIAALRMR